MIIQRGVSTIEPTLIHINGLDKTIETPVSITRCISAAPQTAASKMTIKLNHHLSKTVPTKAQQNDLHECRIYYRALVLDIHFRKVYLVNCRTKLPISSAC